jgi:hypothetical protein
MMLNFDRDKIVVSNGYITKIFDSESAAEKFFGKEEWNAIVTDIHSQYTYSRIKSEK